MSGDSELNVDNIIARLLEGNSHWWTLNVIFVLFIRSSRISAGQNRSNDRRWSTRIMFEISWNLSQSADSTRTRSPIENLR